MTFRALLHVMHMAACHDCPSLGSFVVVCGQLRGQLEGSVSVLQLGREHVLREPWHHWVDPVRARFAHTGLVCGGCQRVPLLLGPGAVLLELLLACQGSVLPGVHPPQQVFSAQGRLQRAAL